MPVQNRGRMINFITGITGVTPGGQAVLNLPVNARYHRLVFQTKAINYTGGANKAVTPIQSATGSGGTATLTITNGTPTAVSVSGGTGWAVNDTFTVADDTGTGGVCKVTAVSSGALSTATVGTPGTPSAISPRQLITSIKFSVNGVVVRDISPDSILRICTANGYDAS